MNKTILLLMLLLSMSFAIGQSRTDTSLRILFRINGRTVDIDRELVRFTARDVLQVSFESRTPLSVEQIRVQPFYLKASTPQQQPEKIKLVVNEPQNFPGFSRARVYSVSIPLSRFGAGTITRLKINFINCRDSTGRILVPNNKSFEIFSPLQAKN